MMNIKARLLTNVGGTKENAYNACVPLMVYSSPLIGICYIFQQPIYLKLFSYLDIVL